MSFPHRTSFYDREADSVLTPETVSPFIYTDCGEARRMTAVNGGSRGCYPIGEKASDKFIPLASTGLEDSEANEVFEGHLLDIKTNGDLSIVIWDSSRWFFQDLTKEDNSGIDAMHFDVYDYGDYSEIKGHALTDPDLVPDSFDVEEYFELEGKDHEDAN